MVNKMEFTMKKIDIDHLSNKIKALLEVYGLSSNHASIVTDIYMRASYRGVGHHDIHDLFGRIDHIRKGETNPTPTLKLVTNFGGLESWDGDNGLGELCTWHVTKRSMALAKEHGIGFATVCNSNHFLAAAPYSEIADEEGFLTLILSKSPGGISLPGADKNIIGNNPFGYGAGHKQAPILFDICNAYSSYGKMNALAKEGKEVPSYWGNDLQGQPTTDPNKILESGLYMPIGQHKGFGLALMVELFTAILAGGTILNQTEEVSGMKGPYSQTAISIDISKLMSLDHYEDRVDTLVATLRHLYPEIYIPGQGSAIAKEAILKKGFFEIDEAILKKFDDYTFI